MGPTDLKGRRRVVDTIDMKARGVRLALALNLAGLFPPQAAVVWAQVKESAQAGASVSPSLTPAMAAPVIAAPGAMSGAVLTPAGLGPVSLTPTLASPSPSVPLQGTADAGVAPAASAPGAPPAGAELIGKAAPEPPLAPSGAKAAVPPSAPSAAAAQRLERQLGEPVKAPEQRADLDAARFDQAFSRPKAPVEPEGPGLGGMRRARAVSIEPSAERPESAGLRLDPIQLGPPPALNGPRDLADYRVPMGIRARRAFWTTVRYVAAFETVHLLVLGLGLAPLAIAGAWVAFKETRSWLDGAVEPKRADSGKTAFSKEELADRAVLQANAEEALRALLARAGHEGAAPRIEVRDMRGSDAGALGTGWGPKATIGWDPRLAASPAEHRIALLGHELAHLRFEDEDDGFVEAPFRKLAYDVAVLGLRIRLAAAAFSLSSAAALASAGFIPLAFALIVVRFLAGRAASRQDELRADHLGAWLSRPDWLADYFAAGQGLRAGRGAWSKGAKGRFILAAGAAVLVVISVFKSAIQLAAGVLPGSVWKDKLNAALERRINGLRLGSVPLVDIWDRLADTHPLSEERMDALERRAIPRGPVEEVKSLVRKGRLGAARAKLKAFPPELQDEHIEELVPLSKRVLEAAAPYYFATDSKADRARLERERWEAEKNGSIVGFPSATVPNQRQESAINLCFLHALYALGRMTGAFKDGDFEKLVDVAPRGSFDSFTTDIEKVISGSGGLNLPMRKIRRDAITPELIREALSKGQGVLAYMRWRNYLPKSRAFDDYQHVAVIANSFLSPSEGGWVFGVADSLAPVNIVDYRWERLDNLLEELYIVDMPSTPVAIP